MTDQQPHDPHTQPMGSGSPTQPVPQYGQPQQPQPYGAQHPQQYGQPQPPAPYGQAQPPSAYAPQPGAVEGWQPPTKPDVPFGAAAKWAVWTNVVLGFLAGLGVYAIAVFFIHLFTELSQSDTVFGQDATTGKWVFGLIPAGIVFVSVTLWGVLVSLIALGLLRLARGYRTLAAAGQGMLAWLVGVVGSSLIGALASPAFSFSGESLERFVNSR